MTSVVLVGALAGCGGGSATPQDRGPVQGQDQGQPQDGASLSMSQSQRCTLLDDATVGRIVGTTVKSVEIDVQGGSDDVDKGCNYIAVASVTSGTVQAYEIDVHRFTGETVSHQIKDDRNTKEGTNQTSFDSGMPDPSLGTTFTEKGITARIEFAHGADVVTVEADGERDTAHAVAAAKALAAGTQAWLSR